MNKKSAITIFALVAFLSLVLAVQPAAARWHHHGHYHHGPGWGEFAVGLGAGIIGGLIINELSRPHYYYSTPRTYSQPTYSSGHWEERSRFVPGSLQWVWEPGHYTQGGAWAAGRWVQQGQPGHWVRERVWVERY